LELVTKTARECTLPAESLPSTQVSDAHTVLSVAVPPTLASLDIILVPRLRPDKSKLTLVVGSAFPADRASLGERHDLTRLSSKVIASEQLPTCQPAVKTIWRVAVKLAALRHNVAV